MPDQDASGHSDTHHYKYSDAPRILEAPGKQARLVGYGDVLLARIEGLRVEPFEFTLEGGLLGGDLLHADYLYWAPTPAILLLQGKHLHQVIGPNYAVIKASKCHDYDPRPHHRDVTLARLFVVTVEGLGMGLEAAVHEIWRRSSS
jgi:hypothetical protein